ncbi:hypothetical protein CK203_108610 [Vitis vinifera]|uniref:Uncharacterized protein n=1 Tax=Vitis vinifera TaxID=29760 RepID=A0A438CY61_VITVI|nr:hypothetical protein CK203_108610 [Vitis vinifera]
MPCEAPMSGWRFQAMNLPRVGISVTAITLGFSPSNFGPSTQTIRAYDGTQRAVIVALRFMRWCYTIFSSSKGEIHTRERNITIQSDRDIVTSFEPVLQISHNEDDLHLTRFTFDEVQVVNLEDDSRDMVPMSFDQYNNTLVLSMMRDMSYMPSLGLGRHPVGAARICFHI